MSAEADLWLNDDEIERLTGYKWRAKQQRALAQMGVPFKVNPRGHILVRRDQAETPRRGRGALPDFGAIRGTGT